MPPELTELRDRQAASEPGRSSRLLYLLKRKLTTPSWVIGAVLIFVFIFLVVIPFFQIVIGTSTWQPEDIRFMPGVQAGKFTLYYFQKTFASMITQPILVKPFFHTITITFFVTIFGLGIGAFLAWLVTRTDVPGRKLIGLIVPITYMSRKILTRITFPLVMPALISSFALIFARTVGSFGAPSFLGLPVRYYTLSTMLYNCIGTGRTSIGFILALLLIILSTVAIAFSKLLTGKRKSYATISGMGTRIHLTRLGRAGTPILALVSIFLVFCMLLPCGLLVYETFMLRDGNYSLSNFTLHYWLGQSDSKIADGSPGLVHNSEFSSALWKSFLLALLTAGITGGLGIFIGYVIAWGGGIAKVLDQITFLPFLIPGISFAAIYLSTGCGKTTTLRMIAGLQEPTSGEILIDGKVVYSSTKNIFLTPAKRRIGLVFQSYALWPHMTVYENVAFGLRNQKSPLGEKKVHEIAMETLERLPSPSTSSATRPNSPADSSSASPSPGCWPFSRACSCWTNPYQTSMPSCAWRCARRSNGSPTRPGRPSSMSPTTSRKLWPSRPASAS